MRFLIALLLIGNYCFAQKNFVILDENKAKIVGASVFFIGKTNELIAVSDSHGEIKLKLVDTAHYLVHALGFQDTEFKANQLQETSLILLKTSIYQLNEVKVGFSKIHKLKEPIKTQPSFGIIDIPQTANTQRVTSIRIDTAGYVKSFKLFCKIYMKDLAPDYRFILFSQKYGKPDSLLIPLMIEGKKSKKEILFDLSKANYYLESGVYFIGYETFNGKAVTKKQVATNKKSGQWISVPLEIYTSEESKISFARNNLSKWVIPKMGKKIDNKMVWEDDLSKNFAYELEMLY